MSGKPCRSVGGERSDVSAIFPARSHGPGNEMRRENVTQAGLFMSGKGYRRICGVRL